MPTGERREDVFIKRFFSGYEEGAWGDAEIDWVDKRTDNAVEAVATRRSDGLKLAIEHTIIEPFLDDKKDFSFFSRAFLTIEQDQTLLVPGLWIRVFVGVGTLFGRHKQAERDAIVRDVRAWIRDNRHTLPAGFSEHSLRVNSVPVVLTTEVVHLPGAGKLHLRRQQISVDLYKVVEKALKKKLPKLVSTHAHKRLLLLERQHMNLYPEQILAEIDKQRPAFPDLQHVDEIWIVETMAYDKEDILRFERYDNRKILASFDFVGTELFEHFTEREVSGGSGT